MKQSWVFYYKVTRDSKRVKFATQDCIKPTMTKNWKELQKRQSKDYDIIGVCLAEAFEKLLF